MDLDTTRSHRFWVFALVVGFAVAQTLIAVAASSRPQVLIEAGGVTVALLSATFLFIRALRERSSVLKIALHAAAFLLMYELWMLMRVVMVRGR